ncbi:MAG: hypothetical protein DMF81_18990 [Acidobacteria bacterium]|nr:MAG: hypothetical protein DMF81_18990 [Acidobacteriota bacterium]
MTIRWAAIVLLMLAGVLYLGAAMPLQTQAGAASEQYRQARDQLRDARRRLATLERRNATRARAQAALGAARSAHGGGLREVRRGVVELVTRAHVSAVRLGVRPGAPPASAAVGLSAEGSFADVIQLAGELARPGSGLVLDRVRVTSRPPRVALDVDAAGLGMAR